MFETNNCTCLTYTYYNEINSSDDRCHVSRYSFLTRESPMSTREDENHTRASDKQVGVEGARVPAAAKGCQHILPS